MRLASEEEIASTIRSLAALIPRFVVSGNFASPLRLMEIVDESRESYRIFVLNAQHPWPRRDGVVTETPFIGPGVRGDPLLHYLPARMSLVPRLFERAYRPDVVLIQTSAPRHGKVSLGIEVNIIPAAIESARRHGGIVIAEINPRMPFTFGDSEIDLDDIDLAIDIERPLVSPASHPLDDVAISIGEQVARFVVDDATLQLGIGDVPDAAVAQLGNRRNLGVWSEMISDGVLNLENSGVLDVRRPVITSFLFGSAELYEWAHANERLLMKRTDVVNDPAEIESRHALVSVNAAIEIDLYAQANATHVRGKIYSGFGGQPDFVAGALHSRAGHAIIALRSWHAATDRSCVVPLLSSPVCTFQHSVLISEHGAAEIFGRTRSEQSQLIIENVAHPQARDELHDASAQLG